MKLYELPRQTHFIINKYPEEGTFFFDHLDGMYSVCYDDKKNLIHLAAFTEVEII